MKYLYTCCNHSFELQSKEKSLSRICSPSSEVFSNPVDPRALKRLGSIVLSQHANTETLIHHLNKYHENKLTEFMWILLTIQTPNSLLLCHHFNQITGGIANSTINTFPQTFLCNPQHLSQHLSLYSTDAYLALAIAVCDCAAILSL